MSSFTDKVSEKTTVLLWEDVGYGSNMASFMYLMFVGSNVWSINFAIAGCKVSISLESLIPILKASYSAYDSWSIDWVVADWVHLSIGFRFKVDEGGFWSVNFTATSLAVTKKNVGHSPMGEVKVRVEFVPG